MKKIQSLYLPALAAGIASILTSGIACADNVFVSNNGNSTVEEISGDSVTTFIDTDLNSPTGVAIYGNDIYVANNGAGTDEGYIEEYSLSTGLPVGITPYASDLNGPRGLAFDSAGNLYVAEQGSQSILEILTGGGSTETLATGLNAPNDVVFYDNTLYATAGGAGQIDTISGGIATPLVTGLSSPNGIAIDSAGDLVVVDHNDSEVLAFNPMTGASVLTGVPQGSLDLPKTIAVDSAGYIYVTDNGNEEVTEYNAAGALVNTFTTDIDNNPAFSGSGFIVTDLVVPEPSTYVLLTAGLGLLFFMARRKTATA
jgi:hypothetical protein